VSDLRIPRPAIISAVAVVLALLAVFLVRPLLAGGSSDTDAMVPAATETDDESEPAADEVAISDEPLPIVTYEVVLSRDPFEPVREATVAEEVTETVTTPGSPTTTPVTGGTEDPATGDPTAPDPGTSDPVAPPSGCTSSGDVVCDGAAVSLIDVTAGAEGRTVIVQVGTSVYEAAEGDTFAGRFRVLSIGDTCADFLFGDDRFSLCEGDRVLK
jgi:hypothetical protein